MALPVSASGRHTHDELFGNRLLFDEGGRPLVPVGMMRGRNRVEVVAEGSVTVHIGDAAYPMQSGQSVVVTRKSGRPARVDRYWILQTLEHPDRQARKDALKHFGNEGHAVELISVGGLYGVKGTVVDLRAVHVATRNKPPAALFTQEATRPVEFEQLVELPSVQVVVLLPSGKPVTTSDLVEFRPRGEGRIIVRQVEHSVGYASHGFADRRLRGSVVMAPDGNGRIAVVNIVPESAVVAGVLPSEMFASGPIEALKAQAVTARGELFAKIGRRHGVDPYLVCSEQHCQVYKGLSAEHPRSNQAAFETRGQLLFKDGRLVDSVYSACCGGHTESNHIVWDQHQKAPLTGTVDAPGAVSNGDRVSKSAMATTWDHGIVKAMPATDLSSEAAVREFLDLPRETTFCGASSFNQKTDAYRWVRSFSADQLNRLFAADKIGDVKRLVIDERGKGGRLRSLVVVGTSGKVRIHRELPVRRRFKNLKSGLFVVDHEHDPNGRLSSVTLRGAGHGHGSGMCQQGAIGMAEAGHDYRTILRHYYNGAKVRDVF